MCGRIPASAPLWIRSCVAKEILHIHREFSPEGFSSRVNIAKIAYGRGFFTITKQLLPVFEGKMTMEKNSLASQRLDLVLDTDTYNEMDDQYAVVWTLLCPERFNIRAYTAAPFYNDLSVSPQDGMEKSYQELLRIMKIAGREDEGLVYSGSCNYLPDNSTPVDSPAARRIVELGREALEKGTRLTVLGIAAPTNIASALLMAPEIASAVDVIWLGGQPACWPVQDEFNYRQDVAAVQVLFNSGALKVQIPGMMVSEMLMTSLSELEERCNPYGKYGEYLYSVAKRFMNRTNTRVIWDIATVAYLICPEYFISDEVDLPQLLADGSFHPTATTGNMCQRVRHICRDGVFNKFFDALKHSMILE